MGNKIFSSRKRIFIKAIAITLFGFAMQSCLDDNEPTDYLWRSLGIVEKVDSTNYYIHCDDGDTLSISSSINFGYRDKQRVLADFNVIKDDGNREHCYKVSIRSIKEILYKEPVAINNENKDSLGVSRITIQQAWITNDMLNIQFVYLGGANNIVHYINLAYSDDSLANMLLKNPKTLDMELRHNSNKDPYTMERTGFVTFDLRPLKPMTDEKDSIKLNISAQSLSGVTQKGVLTYKY